jgi:putative oxidoreductase
MKRVTDWLLSRRKAMHTGRAGDFGLLILRLWVGLMMAFAHGWGKLSTFSERASQFPDPLGVGSTLSLSLAVFAEFFCALAIALGFITRGAVIPVMTTMLVAAFVIHSDDPFGKKELALLCLAPLLTILFTGPGRYSVDRWLTRK